MNIGVVVGGDEEHKLRRGIAARLARRWADLVGGAVYEVEMETVNQARNFAKFGLVAETLNAHEYVMWLDSDACVVDDMFDLEFSLSVWGTPATRMWIAQDWNGLCASMYVVRRCEWTLNFLRACEAVGFIREMGGQQDQGTIKHLSCMSPTVQWRIQTLPTSIVTDQTLKPVPTPFVWHLSMGKDTVETMQHVMDAVESGRFEEYAAQWPGMSHGVRYE